MTVYNEGGAPAVLESPQCRRCPSETFRRSHHNMNCESARLQGRRKYQEDRVFCDLHIPILFYGKNGVKEVRIGMVAVFDGHAGAEASEMASKLLSDYFLLHTFYSS
ncbi:putative protein phosphatase 2C 51 [Camellia lanceoleosa]|uniref:Uncharacterized protein n=1 Tax=Camellia lanceoleosa TaxID=1840588 RepID=A0ACC0FQS5_9ERIC|nr:putative protein phosphatase 2C 51 [Camellia lanceoleosa]